MNHDLTIHDLAELIREYYIWRTGHPIENAELDVSAYGPDYAYHSELLGFARWLEQQDTKVKVPIARGGNRVQRGG